MLATCLICVLFALTLTSALFQLLAQILDGLLSIGESGFLVVKTLLHVGTSSSLIGEGSSCRLQPVVELVLDVDAACRFCFKSVLGIVNFLLEHTHISMHECAQMIVLSLGLSKKSFRVKKLYSFGRELEGRRGHRDGGSGLRDTRGRDVGGDGGEVG